MGYWFPRNFCRNAKLLRVIIFSLMHESVHATPPPLFLLLHIFISVASTKKCSLKKGNSRTFVTKNKKNHFEKCINDTSTIHQQYIKSVVCINIEGYEKMEGEINWSSIKFRSFQNCKKKIQKKIQKKSKKIQKNSKKIQKKSKKIQKKSKIGTDFLHFFKKKLWMILI